MGLDYSIDLLIPADRVEALLLATADVALRRTKRAVARPEWGKARVVPRGAPLPSLEETDEFEKPLVVHLPSGARALLPFTHRFETDPVTLAPGGYGLDLDTVLAFPLDDALRRYKADTDSGKDMEKDGRRYLSVGYIYLTVHLGQRYALFEYTAATTRMSLLFRESRSIHSVFLDLLARAGGGAGLIDVETDEHLLLSDPSRSVQAGELRDELDGFRAESDGDETDLFADRFTEHVLRRMWEMGEEPSGGG